MKNNFKIIIDQLEEWGNEMYNPWTVEIFFALRKWKIIDKLYLTSALLTLMILVIVVYRWLPFYLMNNPKTIWNAHRGLYNAAFIDAIIIDTSILMGPLLIGLCNKLYNNLGEPTV